MSDERRLYYVSSEGYDLDLHVSSTDPKEALRSWAEHYGIDWHPDPISVHPLPDPGAHMGAVPWESLAVVEYPDGLPAELVEQLSV